MMNASPLHIAVGLSGGVDSSVAAYLLKQAGHHVTAIFMKNWEEDDTTDYCSAAKDLADAKAICDQLHLSLEVVNFSSLYWERVFAIFLEEYRQGNTPNPDILCNKEIKFNAFLDYAKNRGADFIATGHYAQRTFESPIQLLKSKDLQKDQSYFLHALNEKQLSQSLFPVGHLTKQEVRAIAEANGLLTHDKKDSTGICFIGERKFKSFLNQFLPTEPGHIQTLDGETIGQHDGLMFYTIGQRQGLHIGGRALKAELPWYVAAKNKLDNTLLVVQGEDHPALFKEKLLVKALHWINKTPHLPGVINAKTRYRQKDQSCTLKKLTADDYQVIFAEPQRAITPGQSIVFYQDNICLGGGIIHEDSSESNIYPH